MFQRYIYIVLLFFSSFVLGQEPDKEDGTVLTPRHFSVGLNFNANAGATGWGVGFEYGFQKNYKYRNTLGFTLTNIRHPKEFKIYSDFSNTRGFFFGKINSLVAFRPTYGGKRYLFRAKRENGIEIAFKWSAGPSFGLVKPVYLRINKQNSKPIDERYNPSIHNFENIASRSNWTKGLNEATIKVGGFTKVGVDFNFSTEKNKISGGEIGFMIDYIAGSAIQLLHNNSGNNFFAVLYLQFNLGQKL